jgi:hypothetical protein
MFVYILIIVKENSVSIIFGGIALSPHTQIREVIIHIKCYQTNTNKNSAEDLT